MGFEHQAECAKSRGFQTCVIAHFSQTAEDSRFIDAPALIRLPSCGVQKEMAGVRFVNAFNSTSERRT